MKNKVVDTSNNIKDAIIGLITLTVVLAELVAGYILATQDNRILQVVAAVLVLNAGYVLAGKFVK